MNNQSNKPDGLIVIAVSIALFYIASRTKLKNKNIHEGLAVPTMFKKNPRESRTLTRDFKSLENTDLLGSKAKFKSNTRKVKFLGRTQDENLCRDRCNMRSNCEAYSWHHPDYPNRSWAELCYGITDVSKAVMVSNPKMSSGTRNRAGTQYLVKATKGNKLTK